MSDPNMTQLYENLPDNSHAAKKEKAIVSTTAPAPTGKRVEKMVQGTVKTKKNNARKLTDIFIAEDIANVKDHILMDVIVPSIKKALYDVVTDTLNMTLFGGRANGKRSNADRVSYRDYSSTSQNNRSYNNTRSNTYSFDDIVIDNRGEAEAVLSRLDEVMEEYGVVRVADLYDLVGITGEHTDNKYGWTNIKNARVVSVRGGGYTIDMPRALPIR